VSGPANGSIATAGTKSDHVERTAPNDPDPARTDTGANDASTMTAVGLAHTESMTSASPSKRSRSAVEHVDRSPVVGPVKARSAMSFLDDVWKAAGIASNDYGIVSTASGCNTRCIGIDASHDYARKALSACHTHRHTSVTDDPYVSQIAALPAGTMVKLPLWTRRLH